MLKKTRLYVAIALVVQAVSFAAMFIILCAKKKSIAYAFLALAALEGAAGAYLLKEIKDEARASRFGDLRENQSPRRRTSATSRLSFGLS